MTIERLKALEDEMHKCFRCNLCKMVPLPVVKNPDYFDNCPANREFVFHSYSGSGKQIMALALVQGRIAADRKLADITFACTTCGSCDVACKFNMDAERMQVNMALREHMVEQGLEPSAVRNMIENMNTHGRPFGTAGKKQGEWASGLGLKVLPDQKADVLLFSGCLTCMDEGSAEAAGKLAKLLKHAGIDIGILGESEPCCGLPAYWTGNRNVFVQTARKSAETINRTGAGTVVLVSGSCLGAMRSKYPEYAEAPQGRIVHAVELLWELIEKGRLPLNKPVHRKVTYHDPCYLGRQSEPPVKWEGKSLMTHGCMTYNVPTRPVNRGTKGCYDAPRNILRVIKGLDFREMHRIREYAFCCGGGGGVPETNPSMAASAAAYRIAEAADVGAECLVTACHHCRINFNKSRNSSGNSGPAVTDIIDLVYEAAGL